MRKTLSAALALLVALGAVFVAQPASAAPFIWCAENQLGIYKQANFGGQPYCYDVEWFLAHQPCVAIGGGLDNTTNSYRLEVYAPGRKDYEATLYSNPGCGWPGSITIASITSWNGDWVRDCAGTYGWWSPQSPCTWPVASSIWFHRHNS
jgi:hypothetical protein